MPRENVAVGSALDPVERATIAAGGTQTRHASNAGGLDRDTVGMDVDSPTYVERGLGADTR